VNVIYQTLLLLAGQVLHILGRTYEQDKAVPDRAVTPLDVAWRGPEKWRTLLRAGAIALLGLTGMTSNALAAGGIVFTQAGGLALVLIGAGYNFDSILKKLFALGQPKGGAP
jgi:hypothetical protein